MGDPAQALGQARSSPPRWYRLAWFLGRAPALSSRQWRVLGLVSIVSLFEQYDTYLLALNLSQIQRDLAIAEANLGALGSIVRAGSLLALPVALAADRLGRRRLLLFTVLAYTAFTGATALAQSAEAFVVLQFLARTFASAETLVAVVVIAEEFAPEQRGWGIGALGAIQGCGAGLAALLFGFVEWLPFGWRSLYLVGLVPLLFVARWRRTLPETERFTAAAATRQATSALAPVGQLVRRHRRRLALVLTAVFGTTLVAAPAAFFAPKYLQDVHGWSPAAVAALNLCGGALAIIGSPLAGWLSDRRGRRPVTSLFGVALALGVGGFYLAGAWVAPVLWVAFIFALLGGEVTFSTYGAELFPTAARSTATGLRGAFGTLGGVAGLAAVTALFPLLGSNWSALIALAALGFAAPLLVWLAFPETARQPLEKIAPDV